MGHYDYSLLRQQIEVFGMEKFASGLGVTSRRLDKLLRGSSEFRADEIIAAAILLELRSDEIKTYFFKLCEDFRENDKGVK